MDVILAEPVEPDLDFEAAFDDLYPRAVRVARRMLGDQALAEDVAAEALARAYARWRKVAGLEYRTAWVLRVTTNLALDELRRRKPTAEVELSTEGAEDVVALRLALAAALRGLPRRQREAVSLRYLADLSEQEVAAALGVAPGSVKTHVHRGLE
ncbi:MAG TPA: sigma-70 family RNA polymerase sigma factor, partial [Acidimicrobiia bacterium]|nr:sigma-70 family RNA polymerase sigma factor [Acidimicrobiia bacterium]